MEILRGKRVLITGASGFIGKHLCGYLSSTGAEINASGRNNPEEVSPYRWWTGDLTSIETVRQIFANVRPEFIFHLAATAWGGREHELVLPTFKNCLETTVNILVCAEEFGCQRVVIPGSLEEPELGEMPVIPSSPYAAAKWGASTYGLMFHSLYKTPVVIGRVFMAYGPGQNREKVIPYIISSFLNGKTPILSSGDRPIDWIFIDDVVEGLVALSISRDVIGTRVDLGSGQLVAIRAIAEKIAEMMGVKYNSNSGETQMRFKEEVKKAIIGEAQALMGWLRRVPLEDGLHRTIDWYKGQTLLNHGG